MVGPDSPVSPDVVRCCLERARASGYRSVLTNAVTASESEVFVDAGFSVRERLHLLARDLHEEPPVPAQYPNATPDARVERAGRRDRAAVLELDAAAFDTFWQLGNIGLADALGATPANRFRVVREGDVIAGYAITGHAGEHGYVQRLAVDPATRRRGLGRVLVADGLRWLWRHGATRAFVNTQLDNRAAFALYESLGFAPLPVGLYVLGRPL